MSKLETGGAAQSLEEILASIRKSLDDESTKGLSEMSKPSAPAADARLPAEPAADGLSSRLAGALGGAGTSVDGALADFFAHRPQKDQPAPEAPATPSAKPVEAKDPIWFLTRPGVAGDGPGKGEAAPSPASDVASPSATGEEVKLSRPETLRPSLPPLFAADRPASSGAAPAATQPAVKAAGLASSGAAPVAAQSAVKATGPASSGVAPVAAQPVVKAAGPRVEKVAEQAAPLKGDRPDPPLASATGSASPPAPATQSTAAPSAAQGPALEEMIAQMLEPVLVRWLDTNLPRMIEGVVRAEVDRVLARGR
jgi:cell pole-organizing protein PopZ